MRPYNQRSNSLATLIPPCPSDACDRPVHSKQHARESLTLTIDIDVQQFEAELGNEKLQSLAQALIKDEAPMTRMRSSFKI